MPIRALLAAVVVVVAVALAAPAAAVAAPKVPALKLLSWAAGSQSDGQGTLIVSGELPDSTSLPAKLVMPVPPGLTPAWVGEIVGANPSQDPTATYTVSRGKGFDVLTITLTSSRTGQVEFLTRYPASGNGTLYSASLTILGPVAEAVLAIEPPAGSTVESVTAGLEKAGSAGRDRYSITKKSPAVGSVLSGSLVAVGRSTGASGVQAAQGTTSTATGDPSSASGSGLTPLGAAVLAAAAGFALYALWANRERLAHLLKAGSAGTAEPAAEEKPPVPRRDASSTGSGGQRSRQKSATAGAARHADRQTSKPASAAVRPEPLREAVPEPEAVKALEPDAVAILETAPIAEADQGPVTAPAGLSAGKSGRHDLVTQVKRVAAMRADGSLSADEFDAAKRGVLAGEDRLVPLLDEVAGFYAAGLLPADEFSLAKEHLLTGSPGVIAEIGDLAALNADGLLTREEFRVIVDRILGS